MKPKCRVIVEELAGCDNSLVIYTCDTHATWNIEEIRARDKKPWKHTCACSSIAVIAGAASTRHACLTGGARDTVRGTAWQTIRDMIQLEGQPDKHWEIWYS